MKNNNISVVVFSQNGIHLRTYQNVERFYFDKNQTIIIDKRGNEYTLTGVITIIEDKENE